MKKIVMLLMFISLGIANTSLAVTSNAPQFDRDFSQQLTQDPNNTNETVFNPNVFKISKTNSLQQNIYNLFSPTNDNSVLWNMIRIIMIGVLVLYFAWTGIDFLMNPNDEGKQKSAKRSFIYLLFGAFLVYGVTRILGRALQIDVVQ
jgi:hypothetical protein